LVTSNLAGGAWAFGGELLMSIVIRAADVEDKDFPICHVKKHSEAPKTKMERSAEIARRVAK